MESMLYKIPIITSDIIGTKDLIRDNINGFLCKTESIKSYKEKILILLYNKELKERFTEYSYKKIITNFNWDVILNKYTELYV